ncbi:stage II sporulation protein M [Candidatus Woesearchaeota archaeon]|nr:stage II sporulation protein M [Candidatus Woesearchaeota archaeon]
MVLESLINPMGAERNPRKMFLYGLLYSSVAVFLSLWIFEENASLVVVFLTTVACIPLIYNTLKMEEQKDETIVQEKILLKEHWKALSFFMFLFIGVVVSLSFWYVVLPTSMTDNLFSVQSDTITKINQYPTGSSIQFSIFSKIFMNNLQVLVFCILFAFLYGVGAIFILTWNASVIAAAIGIFIKAGLAELATVVGIGKTAGYFKVVSLGLLRYSIHGIPEILAYFIAGLGAGIIAIAILRHRLDFERFKRVLVDSTDLIVLSLVVLFIAALLEVYVTPLLF